ncbi:MAG: hypothetical protein JXR25_14020 [Pontiellaceae bacterium]|nr:hypothetical protein [Pontiellaceae bacterium]MBN2785935.1 hypothetical protein [Pontiellaceae bacterium]
MSIQGYKVRAFRVCLLCALFVFGAAGQRSVADDEADIRALLADIDAKVVAHDASGVMAHYSSGFFHAGEGYDVQYARWTENLPEVSNFVFNVESIEIEGDFATVTGVIDILLIDGESFSMREPNDGDDGLGWLKREDGAWHVFGNQSRASEFYVSTINSITHGDKHLRIVFDSEYAVSNVVVSGSGFDNLSLQYDSGWDEYSAWLAPDPVPAVGTVYTFEVDYTDGVHETLQYSLQSWQTAAPEVSVIFSNGVPIFSWNDIRDQEPNVDGYMIKVSGSGVDWRMYDIPASQTSLVFNADGAFSGLLKSNEYYWIEFSVFNSQNNDYVATVTEFNLAGTPVSAVYRVYGGSSFSTSDTGYNPVAYGYAYLGEGNSTASFSGSYNVYIIKTAAGTPFHLDAVKGSNEQYMPQLNVGTIYSGNVDISALSAAQGPPDEVGLRVGASGNTGYYVVVATGKQLDSITVYLSDSPFEETSYNLLDYRGSWIPGTVWLYSGNDWDGVPSDARVELLSTNQSITCYTGGASATPYTQTVMDYASANGSANPDGSFTSSDSWSDYSSTASGSYSFWGDSYGVLADGGLDYGSTIAVGQTNQTSAPFYEEGSYLGVIEAAVTLIDVIDVTVPSDTYTDCLHLRFNLGGFMVWDEWWAQGVGVVKLQGVSGDGSGRLRELESYHLPFSIDDLDGDELPDWWETQYYSGATNAHPSAICANGVNTVLDAYVAGFDPTDPAAGFNVGLITNVPSGFVLNWVSVTDRLYSVWWSGSLTNAFVPLSTNITYPQESYTDAVHSAETQGYYRLKVEVE